MATHLRLLVKQFRFELVASAIAVLVVFIADAHHPRARTAILPTKECSIDG